MKDPAIYLEHIQEAMAGIEEYVACGHERYEREVMLRDALVRRFEILGEAAKRIGVDIRDRYPDVPWSRMAGLRDRAIHDYMGLDMELIWNLAVMEIPRLRRRVEGILSELKRSGGV